MEKWFQFDERLGIEIPVIEKEWTSIASHDREQILWKWEQIRGTIPQRIFELERFIIHRQQELDQENNFVRSCTLNSEISEIASRINDLHLWYRTHQDFDVKSHLG